MASNIHISAIETPLEGGRGVRVMYYSMNLFSSLLSQRNTNQKQVCLNAAKSKKLDMSIVEAEKT